MTENDNLTPKVPCSRCGVRYVEDLTKDERGRPIPEVDLPDFERLCEPCSVEVFSEGVSRRARLRVPLALEEFCGLTTADKETIKALISLVSNHDKAIMVANAMTRVDVLEQRLDNKTAAVEETLERKLDSMDRQRSNYSLAFNVALFVCGVLAGIVVTLVFG